MITDRIGRHEVLLPINHNFTKFVIYKVLLFQIKTKEIVIFFLQAVKKKKRHLSASDMTRTVLNCPIKLKSGQLITNQI